MDFQTDPDCSHCKELMPELEKIAMEKRLKLKVIIYPLLGEKSRDMAAWAIGNNASYEEYKQIQPDFKTGSLKCARADIFLKKTFSFFLDANLNLVPLVISGDGEWIVEGNDLNQIKINLGMNPAGDDLKGNDSCGSK